MTSKEIKIAIKQAFLFKCGDIIYSGDIQEIFDRLNFIKEFTITSSAIWSHSYLTLVIPKEYKTFESLICDNILREITIRLMRNVSVEIDSIISDSNTTLPITHHHHRRIKLPMS